MINQMRLKLIPIKRLSTIFIHYVEKFLTIFLLKRKRKRGCETHAQLKSQHSFLGTYKNNSMNCNVIGPQKIKFWKWIYPNFGFKLTSELPEDAGAAVSVLPSLVVHICARRVPSSWQRWEGSTEAGCVGKDLRVYLTSIQSRSDRFVGKIETVQSHSYRNWLLCKKNVRNIRTCRF